jgi:phospholipid transport system transporter-binding protein
MKLPPALTLEQAAAALQALPADGEPGVIDASALREFDSSALALLLQAKRLADASGRAFDVHAAPPQLAQLARLYGVDALLGLAPQGAGE